MTSDLNCKYTTKNKHFPYKSPH